ncbi:aminotransferase class I/II-fold pyridoxal phosphate-dependent enzyme [Flavitalea sp. BT771]|uniref:trans-sulfuration enzyme family protein n=1 Tax=Flavitalea sp. BT771 TaxID=3063329 RepID=UPI0026E2AB21|nr:aminotransferase class I/II-fold pyridoxal phosphate-dependent enzyme [Flavitalea sp. BT771]MDO6434087.1 aminotransferase class I/II-fold pyridoxal phosphate-dependent enzyme [Flavitalea sp. BT771]MDV6222987.1 aminotransferase class I/II-fold pyridoxal phosphate-dependent enzyme [Flavitalea sp. BT771]
MDISYIINELGEDRELYFNAVAPPIMQTSNFRVGTVAALKELFDDEYSGYLYSRGLNPTVEILRKKLAALDGAEDCLVFNSGAAATFAAVLANVGAGDHIVSVERPYTWSARMFDVVLPRFGVTTTYIDGTQIENFERAILPNTRVIYLESPNSWEFKLQDLRAVAELARAENIITIVDNSYCTSLLQRPIEMGIDIAMQTATKYIGGHSDALGGVLTGSGAMMKKIFDSEYLNIGSGIQPFNAWLLLRGLRTMPARLERIAATTRQVTEFLKGHPRVERVLFPFDETFPQYELATRQMQGACGLLSFYVRATEMGQIVRLCESLRHIMMAVSWGGHESLILPRCASLDPVQFDPSNDEHRMLRLYTGLEDAGYLIADLEQAFLKAW